MEEEFVPLKAKADHPFMKINGIEIDGLFIKGDRIAALESDSIRVHERKVHLTFIVSEEVIVHYPDRTEEKS